MQPTSFKCRLERTGSIWTDTNEGCDCYHWWHLPQQISHSNLSWWQTPVRPPFLCCFYFGGWQTTVTFRTESLPAYSALSPPIPSNLMSPVPPLLGALEWNAPHSHSWLATFSLRDSLRFQTALHTPANKDDMHISGLHCLKANGSHWKRPLPRVFLYLSCFYA